MDIPFRSNNKKKIQIKFERIVGEDNISANILSRLITQ